jgi:phenylalanyl-tRNA synthetase beta chain
MFEIDLTTLRSAATAAATATGGYEPFGRFPDSTRDLALVLDRAVPAGEVVSVVKRNRLAVEASVFDVYEGRGLPEGKKSVAVRVVYRSPKRTLTTEDVTRAEKAILRALNSQLGAELRT